MTEINIEEIAHNAAEKVIQELRDDGVFVARWIPVSEGLPKNSNDVLVTDGEDIFIGWHTYDWNSDDSNFFPESHPIKAWIPLPEPYKEKEVEE